MIYETIQGEMLDEIVFRYYGKADGYVEKVLEANRHLADLGPIYEAGVNIHLPEIKSEREKPLPITLWD